MEFWLHGRRSLANFLATATEDMDRYQAPGVKASVSMPLSQTTRPRWFWVQTSSCFCRSLWKSQAIKVHTCRFVLLYRKILHGWMRFFCDFDNCSAPPALTGAPRLGDAHHLKSPALDKGLTVE